MLEMEGVDLSDLSCSCNVADAAYLAATCVHVRDLSTFAREVYLV